MKEQAILEAAKKLLIEKYPQKFQVGCVHLVEYPVCVKSMGGFNVQIYPSGASFFAEGGGNLGRRQSVGIRIWLKVASDALGDYEEMGRQIREYARLIIKALHERYEPEIVMQEPFFAESTSPTRSVEFDEVGIFAYRDLAFRCAFISNPEDLLADP